MERSARGKAYQGHGFAAKLRSIARPGESRNGIRRSLRVNTGLSPWATAGPMRVPRDWRARLHRMGPLGHSWCAGVGVWHWKRATRLGPGPFSFPVKREERRAKTEFFADVEMTQKQLSISCCLQPFSPGQLLTKGPMFFWLGALLHTSPQPDPHPPARLPHTRELAGVRGSAPICTPHAKAIPGATYRKSGVSPFSGGF
ncbi:hypothetical protein METBIDRAFT_185986 [Metschnikowia bicuspidata var. bicuspidata NRRL YB-4993]|uniref:Uncharacterized protein n=1 Tax=Metschnikowia bicuspidata var. bicuspidata NRRL YB-4993 TaxID=869754 RepID=A0A1A0HBX1_9ASCO|nr:hypothetical protein METBIDRAFT_185986 [Metschnikowia bicuspidata var. bicuspidata NRRL YB-4993]OBA21480.1 hypothetical protein METBIDRAFT_185986 [Metschnikowia bicuspidata var. bicuspidata NRRL YB-4993]